MRIAVISAQVLPCPPVGYSGLEMIVWQLAKGLAQHQEDVTLIAPDGSSCPNCKVIPTGPCGRWDERRAYQKYKDVLPQFDVIIDHSWNKWSYINKIEGNMKTPVLGVFHAPINTMLSSLPPLEKPCIICISHDQKSQYESMFNGYAEVAYNGIDLDLYRPMENMSRDSLRMLFLARFSTIKGPDIAINSCVQNNLHLDCIGDTSITGEPDYFNLCKKLASNGDVKIHGNAMRGECVWWYNQSSYLIHPNMRYREPFGLAPVEAMACGCPVIAWDYGAMRETIQDDCGYLVKSIDELNILLNKISQGSLIPTKEQSRRCIESVQRFSVDNMVNRYLELCNKALSGGW